MKFSVCLACDTKLDDFNAQVGSIEDLGFHALWLTDIGLKAFDVFTFMTIAVTSSQRLHIGAAVHPPQLRHPAVTLNGLVTLSELSQGRMFYGVGTGDPTLLRPIGRSPLKLVSLRELVELSRKTLAGESVSSNTAELIMRDAKLAHNTIHPLPIYIAATSRKALSLSAEIADGVIAHVGASRESVALALASCSEKSGARAFDFTPYLYLSISEGKQEALAACAKGAKTIALRAPHLARVAGCSAEQEQRLLRRETDIEDIITEPLIDKLTLSGTISDIIRKLEAISDLGIEHVTLYPRGQDIASVIEVFGTTILPRFSGCRR